MSKKKTHELKRYRAENSTNWNLCETWLKKKKRTPRIDCGIVDKDFQEEMYDTAKILLLLKYGESSDNSSSSSNTVIPRRRRVENHPNPVLPLNFKTAVHQLTGSAETEIPFVFEKTLFKSDVSRGQNRFLIPFMKIKNEFLTEKEKQRLETRNERGILEMEVDLIQPSLEVCTINLKKWNMGDSSSSSSSSSKKKKKKKKTSQNYVLVTSWNKVVKENELAVGSIVQLWSFRKEGHLCFALVNKDSDVV